RSFRVARPPSSHNLDCPPELASGITSAQVTAGPASRGRHDSNWLVAINRSKTAPKSNTGKASQLVGSDQSNDRKFIRGILSQAAPEKPCRCGRANRLGSCSASKSLG